MERFAYRYESNSRNGAEPSFEDAGWDGNQTDH